MAWCEIWTSRTKHLLAHVYSAAACSNPCKDVLFSLSQNIKPFSATLHCNWADKQPLTHFLGGATTKQNMAMQGWPPTNDYKEWMWSFCFFSAIFLIFVWVFFFPSNGSLRVNSSQVGETRFPHNAVGLDVSCSATRVALCWKTQSGTPNSLMERRPASTHYPGDSPQLWQLYVGKRWHTTLRRTSGAFVWIWKLWEKCFFQNYWTNFLLEN